MIQLAGALGMDVAALADYLSVDPSTVYAYQRRPNANPTTEKVRMVQQLAPHVPMEWFYDALPTPVPETGYMGTAGRSNPVLISTRVVRERGYEGFIAGEIEVWPDLPAGEWEEPGREGVTMAKVPHVFTGDRHRLTKVRDDSLSPVATRGQQLVIVKDDNPREGMLVFARRGKEVRGGFLERSGPNWILRPPNPDYPPVELSEDWERLGFVGAKAPYVTEARGSAVWDFVEGIRD